MSPVNLRMRFCNSRIDDDDFGWMPAEQGVSNQFPAMLPIMQLAFLIGTRRGMMGSWLLNGGEVTQVDRDGEIRAGRI